MKAENKWNGIITHLINAIIDTGESRFCWWTVRTSRARGPHCHNFTYYLHYKNILFQGRSENGVYLQAWQFATVPGKLVTAIRISDMGIFFLTIEIERKYLLTKLM